MIWLTWRQFRAQAAASRPSRSPSRSSWPSPARGWPTSPRRTANVFDHLTATTATSSSPASSCSPWHRRSSARSGARRWSPASWRPAPTGWSGPSASPAPAGWRPSSASRRSLLPWRSACSPSRSPGGRSPLDGALSSTHGSLPSRLTPVSFAMRGIVPVGYAVFAVVLGVDPRAVLRRSLPAMAVTLARRRLRADRRPDSGSARTWSPTAEQTVTFDSGAARRDLDRRHRPGLAAPDHREHRRRGRLGAVQPDRRRQRTGRRPARPGSPTASRRRRPRGPPTGRCRSRRPTRSTPASPASPPRATGSTSSTSRRSTSGRCSGPRPGCSSCCPACSPASASGGSAAG